MKFAMFFMAEYANMVTLPASRRFYSSAGGMDRLLARLFCRFYCRFSGL